MSRDNEWAGNAPGYKQGYEFKSDRMRLDYALQLDANGFLWFYPMTKFIVIRGTGSDYHDGLWLERERLMTSAPPLSGLGRVSGSSVTANATGLYERREDGMIAEVYAVGGQRPQVKRRRTVLGAITPSFAMSYGSAVR